MKFIGIPQKYRQIAVFILSVLLLCILMPKTARFSYDYKKGSSWKYETLVAQFDFPIYKSEDQIRQERDESANVIVPYYKYSEDVVNHSIRTADALSLGEYAPIKPILISTLRNIYSRGVISNEIKYSRNSNLSTEIIFVQKNKRAEKRPLSEVYKQSDACALLIAELSGAFPKFNLDSLFRANGIYDIVAPNLIFDEQTTDLVQAEINNDISPTQGYVKAGQLIVSKDEIITSEIEQILDSYKQEYNSNTGYTDSNLLTQGGRIVISILLISILFLVILLVEPGIFSTANRLYYILFIFFLIVVPSLFVGNNDDTFIFLVPFTLGILYLRTFFKFNTIIPLYATILLPLMIFRQNGPLLFAMYFCAGLAASSFFRFGYRGWKQFIPSFVSFVILLASYYAFKTLGFFNNPDGNTVLYMAIGSFFASAAYPLAYIFERIFNLLSNTRLNELTDSDNVLIRDLEEKAPGTFQHCLQVMSMAEAVGRAIDANLPLLRAGALYHDIGKTVNPLCFVENSTIVSADEEGKSHSYHTDLSPQESASAITRHVIDGLALADKYHLPVPVRDFIQTHHGTSRVGFFYNKYVNDGGDPTNTAPFTYQGCKPQTKEQVIVMICDSIEAASRTLKDNSAKTYSDFVENMVAAKISDGQFDEADISYREINIIKDALKSYLAQMYHERVAYPKRKKTRN